MVINYMFGNLLNFNNEIKKLNVFVTSDLNRVKKGK